ncbi:hypothetical protein KVF89_09170 [Nocardioides carbamazepini]|uniref:hypothetical protein n=1 Tax=Nocardioides carbamazepini TaxID=2854259 RepID=UPI00214A01F3|nr:hypothetical protein [Nocardioides carbamazepini]MCR1782701.1 hypothetical protein [Nocardioides carbamazepini]
MSVLGLTKLARALEHEDGLLERFRSEPGAVMDRFVLDDAERASVLALDANDLRERGMNPVALRNLLVLLGVPHGQMYVHTQVGMPPQGRDARHG